jgi:hypothetical protein
VATLRAVAACAFAALAVTGCNELIGATDPIGEDMDTGAPGASPSDGSAASDTGAPNTGCVQGSLRCSSLRQQQVCRGAAWVDNVVCPYVCDWDGGACTGVCAPNVKRCTDAGLETCGDDGAWGMPSQCPSGCMGDQCSECVPGTTACVTLSAYATCDPSGQWGTNTDCGSMQICRSGSTACQKAQEDIGWDMALGGGFQLFANFIYVFRLPPLTHQATLVSFGIFGTMGGANAKMALYKDSMGAAPTGPAIAYVQSPMALQSGNTTQDADPVSTKLDAGTYWIAVVVDSNTTVSAAVDMAAPGEQLDQNFFDPYPDLTGKVGIDVSGNDLAMYVTVLDTN